MDLIKYLLDLVEFSLNIISSVYFLIILIIFVLLYHLFRMLTRDRQFKNAYFKFGDPKTFSIEDLED